MSLHSPQDRLSVPESLQAQLLEFRRRVWTVKLTEAVSAAVFGVAVAYLVMFGLDRLWETTAWVRIGLFLVVVASVAVVPLAIRRWVWGHRRLEQLARLLARKHPRVGDQLLGVIELARSDLEQARSRTLCEAAIRQVAEDAQGRDFTDAVPSPRHRLWGGLAAVPAAVALGLLVLCPAAAANAWARLLGPWLELPRYTFAAVEPLPGRIVVAHGEPFVVAATLRKRTAWRPERAEARLGDHKAVVVHLREDRYEFELPPRIEPAWLSIRVGDARLRTRVEPTLRPELTSVVADVALPDYLGRAGTQKKDVRGGAIALVKGSRVQFAATASRTLAEAQVDGRPRVPRGATVSSPSQTVDGRQSLEFRWRDALGLAGKEPFTLAIAGRDDEAPSLVCEDLPRQKVVLDSELLSFQIRARDDFGVRRVGIEWRGVDDPTIKSPARGERVLAAGGPDKEAVELGGTFSAKALGIEPQPVVVRIFTEDYLPGRPRVYSPPSTLYVLNPEQHAVWVTEQLSKWHRQSLEVRDRELQLHETNKQLRALSGEELERPDARRKIEAQAAAEKANGRRLSGLVRSGEELVRQAMRNPEFGVGHLEKWAEMLQILKDIAGNRMPSVAELLKEAAQAPALASNASSPKSRMAGQVRDTRSGKPSESEPAKTAAAAVPQIADRESSQQPLDKDGAASPPSKGSAPSLRLPVTTLAGKTPPSNASCPTAQKVEEAIAKQQDLLAEFDKIADELNRVLANLEGSTLVKRLKAASRLQLKVAGRLSDQLADTFGTQPIGVAGTPTKVLSEMAEQEAKGSLDLSVIMDDLQSYFERRQFVRFKGVLDEMRTSDVIGALRHLGDDLKKESGVSIAQCEYWSDTLDRWAEDLVEPASGGT